ncbi:MAG: pilin [Candidatus Pacebacteria bacterium]|nr:pilin [Candidatus Paceibacterota bacterium]
MKSSKLFVLFSLFFIAMFLLPKFVMADGEYQIQLFEDANQNGIFDPSTTKNPRENEGAGTQKVCYDGLVPCGKVLCNGLDTTKDSPTEGKCKNKIGQCINAFPDPQKPVQCQLCHGFIMVDKAVDYIVIKLVPLLAVLMLVIGGVMFYFGGFNPGLLSRAKTLIKGVVVGLVLIYSAYMIVNIFLMVLGASEINSIKDVFSNGVFSIKCPVYMPSGFFK